MPVAVEDAVVVGEENELMALGQCLGYSDVPRPRRSTVRWQDHVFDIAVSQRVLQRARVICHVHAGEPRRLVTDAVE